MENDLFYSLIFVDNLFWKILDHIQILISLTVILQFLWIHNALFKYPNITILGRYE